MRRSYIPLKTKLAAAVAQILGLPHEHATAMTEDQVLALVNWDHWPRRKADGGTDDFWNLRALPIKEHRTKTAKKDAPEMAKSRRLRDSEEAFRKRLLAKETGDKAPAPKHKRPWPKRGFKRPWRSEKLRLQNGRRQK